MWWQQRDGEARKELCIPVLIRVGEMNYLRAAPEKTVSEILHDLGLHSTYGLIRVYRDLGNNIVGRDILGGDMPIGGLKGIDFEADSPDQCDLWLVDLSMEVTIFFNAYFRMITGTPSHLQRLYIQPGMTVSDVENQLKKNLKMNMKDQRFGLYGYTYNELVRLDGELLMTELKEREDPTDPAYFQFQMHAECENQAKLGISRASNLFMKINRGLIRKRKKCWFYLQGTSIFYRPTISDHPNVKEIKRVDLCKIIYRGGNKSGTLFRFDLVPPEGQGPTCVFTSPLKRRIVRWVRELRRCHPTIQINDPVTMADVRKIKNTRHDVGSTLTRQKNEQIKELSFLQRKAIEVAEAHLQMVELDGALLLHNGVKDEPGHDVGKKWVENIRKLVLHCCRMEATHTASDNITQIHRILKKLREWVTYFEEVPGSHVFTPEMKTIKVLIDECAFLVNCYRVYVVKLNNDPEDVIIDSTQARILDQMLEKLEEALSCSIFEFKPVRKYIVREPFKEELPPPEEPMKPRRRSTIHLDRPVGGPHGVVIPAGPSVGNYDQSLLASAALEQMQNPHDYPPQEADAQSIGNPKYARNIDGLKPQLSTAAWILSKAVGFFRRDFKKKGGYDDELDDDVSFTISLENGDRISDQKWAETEDLFNECAKPSAPLPIIREKCNMDRNEGHKGKEYKHSYKAHSPTNSTDQHNEHLAGYNGFGARPSKKHGQSPRFIPPPAEMYGGVEPMEPKKSPTAVLKTAEDAAVSPSYNFKQPPPPRQDSSEPARTGPEEEALLLRMIKDPRVSGFLQEIKEEAPEVAAVPAAESNNPVRSAWGKSGRRRS